MSVHTLTAEPETHVRHLFDHQRAGFSADPYPSYRRRMEWLKTLNALITQNEEALIQAINDDFGCRSRSETIIAEILGSLDAIHYARKNLRRWMRPRKRRTSFWSMPAKTYVVAQPLGVVGIMAPWNYSLNLSIGPLVAALAAGNRAMVCMSEETPKLCALFSRLISESFDPDLVTVVAGSATMSPEFAALPFDHLLFTGSTRVGKLIATAAAKNLTPVTLELGGKSPAIVAPDYSVKEAADRISWGKTFNAGQTCIAPDYVFVPADQRDVFARAALTKFNRSFSDILDKDYTAIVSERFFHRMQELVDEARQKGAKILQPDGMTECVVQGVHKFPLTIVLGAPKECKLMQEEIFGPVLPVLTYNDLSEVTDYVNAGDRPLSLYCFTHDRDTVKMLLRKTVSGSFGLNETLLQYAQEDLAFGGVGASGQGAYHGPEGFDTFSHLKSVFEQRGLGRLTGIKLLHPPYKQVSKLVLRLMKG